MRSTSVFRAGSKWWMTGRRMASCDHNSTPRQSKPGRVGSVGSGRSGRVGSSPFQVGLGRASGEGQCWVEWGRVGSGRVGSPSNPSCLPFTEIPQWPIQFPGVCRVRSKFIAQLAVVIASYNIAKRAQNHATATHLLQHIFQLFPFVCFIKDNLLRQSL